ncbi:MAG: hypothetical protein GY780_09615 [bacterium]|nr:hypothetical protein [bacterium]
MKRIIPFVTALTVATIATLFTGCSDSKIHSPETTDQQLQPILEMNGDFSKTWTGPEQDIDAEKSISRPMNVIMLGSTPTSHPAISISHIDNMVYATSLDLTGPQSFLEIIDASNPTQPTVVSTLGEGIAHIPFRLAFDHSNDGEFIYISDFAANYEYNSYSFKVDVSDPLYPSVVSQVTVNGNSRGICVDGEFVYDARTLNGLTTFERADLEFLGQTQTFYTAIDVAISGDLAFVSGSRDVGEGNSGFAIVDISDPSNPITINRHSTVLGGSVGWDIEVEDPQGFDPETLAYMVDGHGLWVFDVTDAMNVVEVAHLTNFPSISPAYLEAVDIQGDKVFIAAGYAGVFVFDVSDPSSPVMTGHYDTDGFAWDVMANGNLIYVADNEMGVKVLAYTGQ